MAHLDRIKPTDPDSEDEELSENVERNLESVLAIFPLRKKTKENLEKIDDHTFEKVKHAMKCPICLEIFKDPAYIKECMHRFCRQCIERIIRTQDNKGCPICRIPLGSKRLLRSDLFIENCIKKIFPNLKEYLYLEELEERNYFTSKLRDTNDPKGKKKREVKELETSTPSDGLRLKRSISHKDSLKRKPIYPDSDNSDDNEKGEKYDKYERYEKYEEKKVKKVRRKKLEEQDNLLDDKHDIKEDEAFESRGKENKGLIEKIVAEAKKNSEVKKMLLDKELEEYIKNCDLNIGFSIEPHPSALYLKSIECVKTSSAITIEKLAVYICKKLNLQEDQYKHKITFFGKKDQSFEILDKHQTMKEFIKNYYSHLDNFDFELYDEVSALNEFIEKKGIHFHQASRRVIYYEIDNIDDWFSLC